MAFKRDLSRAREIAKAWRHIPGSRPEPGRDRPDAIRRMMTIIMDLTNISSAARVGGATIFLALHLSIAAAVTVHALLNKRDVSAAIGWIGLAWLSPFMGAALYLGFGVNRVTRRAHKIRRSRAMPGNQKAGRNSVNDPMANLILAIGNITNREIATGSISAPLHGGDEAYPRMLETIEGAQSEVFLSSYIFRADEIGHKFIDALARAHHRGAQVRVLIDGFGGGFLRSSAYRLLRANGVPAARFMHSALPWKMPFLNLRLHKKVLIIDGVVAFVGGLNIGDENVSVAGRAPLVRDAHFRIEGDVVKQIMGDFGEDWLFATGEALESPARMSNPVAQASALGRAVSSGPDQDVDQLILVLASAINAARRSIRIATPYFLPDSRVMSALELAALRGVAVDLVLPAVNNHWLLGWAACAHIPPLLKAGCRIWRSPPPFNHAKIMTVDDHWCLIGSPNWDTRSLRLNFELAIEWHDRDLAGQLGLVINDSRGTRVTLAQLDSRWLIIKCRDAAARLLMPYI